MCNSLNHFSGYGNGVKYAGEGAEDRWYGVVVVWWCGSVVVACISGQIVRR